VSKLLPTNHHEDKTLLGFWMFIMTDIIIFSSLFATYAVLRNNTAGGPAGADIFNLPFVLTETIILLISSLTSGLMLLSARNGNRTMAIAWLLVTILLGASFLALEIYEFNLLISEGHSWATSGFLSSYFTLVGTHGAHIATGLIWGTLLFIMISRKGLDSFSLRRITLFSYFWHFLDIVWIFIFTIVYLLGVSK